MAPEMFSGAGYNFEVDYYSFGVLLYELSQGYILNSMVKL
jgi:serine/threonine protein kinase